VNRTDTPLLICAFLLTLLAACAQLGITKPLTFNEKLATGYSAVTSVLTTSAQLEQQGKIKPADLANIEKQTDAVKEALDLASTFELTDTTAGGTKLTAALTALQALQLYLAGMETPK
jgi:hypothetical protein